MRKNKNKPVQPRRLYWLRFCVSALLMCVSISISNAETYFNKEAIGTTTADFLNLPIGARAAAMGGAYTAISEDASAIFWNPAGLIQISKLSAIFMRTSYVADINYQYMAYAHRMSYDSVLAASALVTDIGAINQTDISGNRLGTFTPKDQVITLSYSRAVLEFSDKEKDLSMGVSVKHIKSKIVSETSSFAGDFGIMTYNFTSLPYRLGIMLTNFGQGLKFDTESNALPMTLKLAGALNPFKNFMLAADIVFPKQNKPNFILGAELNIKPNELTKLSIRGGLNSQMLDNSLGGFSFGLGATLHFFSLDYAFTPMGELGTAHRMSITFDFPFRSPVFERRDRTIFTKIDKIGYKSVGQ
ncbi:MAG: PorV/PorQ family protein [Elusimicrobia bacterium]|nr:PorV/PorQ family protein [Elusimicrobiota bacterium]